MEEQIVPPCIFVFMPRFYKIWPKFASFRPKIPYFVPDFCVLSHFHAVYPINLETEKNARNFASSNLMNKMISNRRQIFE